MLGSGGALTGQTADSVTPVPRTTSVVRASQATPGQPVAAATQDEPPTAVLRVTSRVVAISAVVKRHDGQPATGLTKDELELKVDGKPEAIRYFGPGAELPLTLALLVDTSGSQRTFIGDETIASEVFLQTMLGRQQDRAVVIEINSRVRALGKLTDVVSALKLELMSLGTDRSAMNGTLLNDAVGAVSKQVLGPETGRKAMILLTDGEDNGSRSKLEQAIEQAQQADVQVYAILYSSREAPGPGAPLQVSSAAAPGLDTLRRLADSTGGQVFTVSRATSLRQIYAEIAQDLRLQYQVGYTPPPDLKPGSYHRLELRAKDHRLTVESRKGFFVKP